MWGESMTGSGKATRLGVADCLSLAAAPVFGLMAVLIGAFGGASGMHAPGALDGMTLMYLLMAAFHSAPWLTLFALRRVEARAEQCLGHPASGSAGPVVCCNVVLHSPRRGRSPAEPTT